MTPNRQHPLVVVVILVTLLLLTIPFFLIQDIRVEYDWDSGSTSITHLEFYNADYAGRCGGREELDEAPVYTYGDIINQAAL